MPSAETQGKDLDLYADGAGRAGSVEWFNKQKVTKAGEGENQGVTPKHANKFKRFEAKIKVRKQMAKAGRWYNRSQ